VFEKYEALTKGMSFTAIYVEVRLASEYNVETDKLTIYFEANKEDADVWDKYARVGGNKKAQLRICYKFVDDESAAAFSSTTVPSTQQLSSYQVNGSYVPNVNGYYRYTFPADVVIPEGKKLLIGGFCAVGSIQGGATATGAVSNTTYVKEIASKTDKVVKVAEGNTAGAGYVYSVKIDGVAYFSKLTLTDLQKLYTAAGKTNVITA
jgi:hypothetical protein